MHLELLELAIPKSRPLELETISTTWGPSDTTMCLVSGTVLGQISVHPFGRKHRIQNKVANFSHH